MERLKKKHQAAAPAPNSGAAVATLPDEALIEEIITRDERDVRVTYGAGVQSLPLAGLQVADARNIVRDILNVDPQSPVLVNGREVRDNYRIAAGDQIEFVHAAGEKGAADEHFA